MIDPTRPNFLDTPVAPSRPRFGYALEPRPAGSAWSPAVTIVTPYYNTGAVFRETARSVFAQSLQNFEWLIVNDGSKDDAAMAVLDEFRATDERVRVIDHRVNHGLPAARNTGVRQARAPLVFFLDSDDLIEPTALEKCAIHLALNPSYAFVKGFNVGFGAQEYLWTKGFHDGVKFLEENRATATAMVRRDVLERVGGFDETIRAGMEDWEFWLRCASAGEWGGTIPEFLDWYRRRDNQHADWGNLAGAGKKREFIERMRARHPALFAGDFPRPALPWQMPFHDCAGVDDWPIRNPLKKNAKRLLLIAPWLRLGGADKFNVDLARFLTRRAPEMGLGSWEVTIATTLPGSPWLSEFSNFTPDIFLLDHLTRPQGYAAALSHLMRTRRPDVVMISNSQHGYGLLPFLRANFPESVYVDFNHMEEPHWINGGHPRTGVGYQDQLDLNMVVSGHLKRWMVSRGAEADRVAVCHINADSTTFKPDAEQRAKTRRELGIAEETKVILYAARLCPQKQPRVFAETMRLLSERRAAEDRGEIIALVAGDGEMTAELETALRDTGLLMEDCAPWGVERESGTEDRADENRPVDSADADARPNNSGRFTDNRVSSEPPRVRVRMLGPVAAGKMPGLMAAADVFFLPSLWEGIALSIYEAMAAGLAVVGADVGGQTELVTPECGVLLPMPTPRDEQAEAAVYAETLDELLDDPARIAALGAAARRRIVEHFELDRMGERFLALIDQAKELHDRHPRQRLSPGFARELAVRGIEMMRIHELADYLWPYRDKWLRTASAEEQARIAAEEELRHIESSRTYRVVQGVKKTIVYRAFARVRYGEGWDGGGGIEPKDDPVARLNHVRNSRAFRLIQALKSVPPWSVYVRVRYGARK